MIGLRVLAVAACAATLIAALSATRLLRATSTVSPCSEHARPSLHCAQLVPVPELRDVTGNLELEAPPTPFGVAVTADGHPRWRAVSIIAGLPPASSLGDFTAYIAWVYDVSMNGERKLGEVRNGRVVLGEIAENQFRVIITAERSLRAPTRAGRIVLRGTSPSARLLAHRDIVQPVAPGLVLSSEPQASGHPASHPMESAGERTWRMPPMPPMAPMPGMHSLTPSVAPWMPATRSLLDVPDARPRAVIALRDGDTLALEAGVVRRRINGRTLLMYAFNGQHPGPLIRVRQNATIVVRFRNRIDQPSAVHWHGVRLENASDGVPGVTQDEVPPGEEFLYRVHFKDAGIYWYHPHVREDIQQELGLYGNMLVMPSDARYYGPVHREEVLALDDLLLDVDAMAQFGASGPTHALMGRWGNTLLVNGEPQYALTVRRGEIVRFFLTNVANARLMNVSFPGARMKVVATDVGKLEREEWVESIAIAPAERWVVEVRFDSAGVVPLLNRVQALDHMYGTYRDEVDTLGSVRVERERVSGDLERTFARLRLNAEVTAEVDRYRAWIDREPDHELVLSLRARDLPPPVALMLNGLNVAADWNDGMAMANWLTTSKEITWVLRDAASGRENMDIRWRFTLGQTMKLRLYNDPLSAHAMAHPIHVHGQRFLVLARNGIPSQNLAWKDTAIIPAGETVDLIVEMSNPGRWALHCHVAEHMGAGMMSVFEVAK